MIDRNEMFCLVGLTEPNLESNWTTSWYFSQAILSKMAFGSLTTGILDLLAQSSGNQRKVGWIVRP